MVNQSDTADRLWYSGIVLHGDQSGRTIGFPTINLDPAIVKDTPTPGVYASHVKVDGQTYMGALYYGPRLVKGETHTVLEIYILDFSRDIYDQSISFTIESFIRGVMDFTSMEALRTQLDADVAEVSKVLGNNHR